MDVRGNAVATNAAAAGVTRRHPVECRSYVSAGQRYKATLGVTPRHRHVQVRFLHTPRRFPPWSRNTMRSRAAAGGHGRNLERRRPRGLTPRAGTSARVASACPGRKRRRAPRLALQPVGTHPCNPAFAPVRWPRRNWTRTQSKHGEHLVGLVDDPEGDLPRVVGEGGRGDASCTGRSRFAHAAQSRGHRHWVHAMWLSGAAA